MNCSQCGIAPINKWANCCYKGGSWYKMCGQQNLFPYTWEQGYYSCNINNYDKSSVKLVIPGHGESSRTNGLIRNLKKISSFKNKPPFLNLDELCKRSDVILDCAPKEAFKSILQNCLLNKTKLITINSSYLF